MYGCTHLDLVATAVQHVSLNIYAASVEGQIDAIRQWQQQLDQVKHNCARQSLRCFF